VRRVLQSGFSELDPLLLEWPEAYNEFLKQVHRTTKLTYFEIFPKSASPGAIIDRGEIKSKTEHRTLLEYLSDTPAEDLNDPKFERANEMISKYENGL